MPSRLCLFLFLGLTAFAADEMATSAKLIADHETIAKGEAFQIGLALTMNDHWHTYWENPGSSGLPTTLEIEPVEGLEVGNLQFPLPKRFQDDIGMVTYGYDDRALLIAKAKYSGNAKTLTIKAKASWLECKEICVPGDAELTLTVAVGEAKPAHDDAFQKANAAIPIVYGEEAPFTYQSSFQFKGDAWHGQVLISPREGIDLPIQPNAVKYFPLAIGQMDADLAEYQVSKDGNGYKLDLRYEAYVETPGADTAIAGVVQVPTTNGNHIARLPLYPTAPTANAIETNAPEKAKEGSLDYGLWIILLFGFLGGIILNLMPCVLPVLSLKIFGIIKDAEMTPRLRIQHAWIVTLGISISFLVFSLFFIFSKAAGQQLGIGFQFQDPLFVIFMSALIFVMALSFLGVFHLEPPATNNLYELTQRHGWQGAFFQGALMTVLSTPCTAPLLGTAYGWALSQSPWIILLTFQVIALGLAFPYLLLCHSPKLMGLLPKPGNWMNHFKIGLGFILMATLIWLFSILWELTGPSGLIGTMALLLGLAVACYIFGQTFFSESRRKGLVWVVLVSAVTVYFSMFRLFDIQQPFLAKEKAQEYLRLAFLSEATHGGDVITALENRKTTPEEIAWIPYSKDNLAHFRNKGRIVFMDFTAAWCATCKANEKIFIDTRTIRTAFAEKDVITIKVDYTDRSDEITAMLGSFDRAGVPLYLFYPGNNDAIVLPEAINKTMLLDALDEAIQVNTQKTQLME